jgi:hypothetical protein
MPKQIFQKLTSNLAYKVCGAIVFLFSLIVYLMTVQRTLSLWDCGEFIACSYTLGIAHPPGTPLFLLIGRIASITPLFADISFRVNFLSVFSGAVAATLGYVVSVRLLRYMPGVEANAAKRLAIYICSMIGALLFAFGRTQWSNSVETEVYSLSMALIFLLIWLSLKWFDNRGTVVGSKCLIAIAYLGVLSISLHPTVFLVMPAIFLFILIGDESLRKDLRFWISGILVFSVTLTISGFMWVMAGWMLISLWFFVSTRSKQWTLAFLIAAASLVGFSVHGYIPIRAAERPRINMNDPVTNERFISYLERKQYGQESMFEKMLKRRASWAHQLGDFPRIGFGGYLIQQWGMTGFAFLLPFVLAMLGVVSLIKWRWKVGVFIALVLLACTIGLVIYMNFADGSKINPLTTNDKLEVRDRDYFFTPGFILFGLCIGFGLFAAVSRLIDWVGEARAKLAPIVCGVLALLMPITAIRANFQCNDRSDSNLPYDYAYNFLMTCPQDAILFTNGDNDTFPLWCLQEVYGIRRDVKIANLSLIQTDWYQMQLKYEVGIPISLEDDQMLWENVPDPRGKGVMHRPKKPYIDHLRGGRNHYLMAFQDSTGALISVADLMVENIISANRWKYPIMFANGYPATVEYPLAKHIRRVGWVDQLVSEEANGAWDVATSMNLFTNVYRMKGLDNPKVYRDEVATTLVIGSAQMMMDFSDFLEKTGDSTRSRQMVDLVIEQIPEYWQPYAKRAQILKLDRPQIDSLFVPYLNYLDNLIAINPDNILYYQYKALTMQYLGRGSEAIRACELAYELNPTVPVTYRSLLTIYVSNGKRDDAIRISKEYLKTNPTDNTARTVASGRF